jgi:hypothetical protein
MPPMRWPYSSSVSGAGLVTSQHEYSPILQNLRRRSNWIDAIWNTHQARAGRQMKSLHTHPYDCMLHIQQYRIV